MYYFVIFLTLLYDTFILSCRLVKLFSYFKPVQQQQETQDLLLIMYDFVIEHPAFTIFIMLLLSFLSIRLIKKRFLKQLTPEQYEQLCRKEDIHL